MKKFCVGEGEKPVVEYKITTAKMKVSKSDFQYLIWHGNDLPTEKHECAIAMHWICLAAISNAAASV